MRSVREIMDEHTGWKTPTGEDSLRYAGTEAAEVLDASIRANNPDHARNNDRGDKLIPELGDVVMMLSTYLLVEEPGEEYIETWTTTTYQSGRGTTRDIDILFSLVGGALYLRTARHVSFGNVRQQVLAAIALCYDICREIDEDVNVFDVAATKLEKSAWKFKPKGLTDEEWFAILAIDPLIREEWFTE